MKIVSRILLLFLWAIPFLSYADYSSEQCETLHANDDFSVWFKLDPASLEETVFATKRNGRDPVPIWTNNDSVTGATITDDETEDGHFYDVWLTYETISNKSGLLTYYLSESGTFREVDSQIADLSDLSAAIAVDGDEVEELKCDDDLEQPPIDPGYSLDAQYEFGTKRCSSMPCTINFNNSYSYAPLVFVMPTIDPSEPDDDKPATLVITSDLSSSSTSVTIDQDVVNIRQIPNTVQMTEVSYLIIEPGVADFNGHTVVAGYVETDETSGKFGANGNERVDYSDFGYSGFSSNPVVLHQIQTRNNGNIWTTSGKVRRTNERTFVDLFIELSASNNSNRDYEDEKIAFVSALATNTPIEVDDYQVQFLRGYDTPSQTGSDPMLDGCEDKYALTSLDLVDGVIANKQERAGGHGGWVRRCNIDNNRVSFVIDEDFRDRGHIPEEVGYFAFDKNELEIDLCQYFPEPAQSWKNGSLLNMQNSGSVISGWSQTFIDNNLSNGALTVGFDNVSYHAGLDGACDVGSCDSGGDKVDTPFTISPSFDSNVTLSIEKSNYESVCDGTYCSYTDNGGNDVTIDILSSLKNLTVNAYGISFTVRFEDLGGTYGTEVQNYNAGGDVETYFTQGGVYTFGDMTFSAGGSMSFEQGVTILVENSFQQNNSMEMNDVEGLKDLIIYGPTADFVFNTPIGDFAAQILGDNITFSNAITLRGAITANNLNMLTSNINIIGEGACLTPAPSNDYELSLTPEVDIALSCEAQRIEFQVLDENGDPADDYSGNILVTYSSSASLSVVRGSGSNGVYQPNSSGELWFDVTNQGVGDIEISGELSDSSNDTLVSGDYTFVANKYQLTPASATAIAGKSFTTTVQPMECRTSDSGLTVPVVSTDYLGDKTLSASETNYTQPTSADVINSQVIEIKDENDTSYTSIPSDSFVLNFTANADGEAEATMDVRYFEAGQVFYRLSGTECVIDEDGDEQCKTYSGTQVINARPWTFAVCSDDSVDGTSSSGSGYLATGSAFGVKVKPIIWQSNGSETDDIDTTSLCTVAVTENFFAASAPTATVEITHTLGTPSSGRDGNLTGTVSKTNTDNDQGNNYLEFDDLSWDEVGSVLVQADTASTYLGMNVNLGYRSVGRFYPAQFSVVGTTWDYADSQTFEYMGQPFDGLEFTVEAMGPNGEALQNYVGFADAYKARFNIIENSTNASRFASPELEAGDWALENERSIGTFDNDKVSDCTDSICWNKRTDFEPDGPFNQSGSDETNIILDAFDSNIDPVTYSTDGEVLTTQPDIRFGRIRLSDVGGEQGSDITVPLAVEYWDSSQFIANSDDNSTEFDGLHYCMEAIWPDDSDNASLAGSEQVSSGESRELYATQDTSIREQVRLWLTLDSDGLHCTGGSSNDLPWLRYNWDTEDNAEEDPSVVVTFGVHRGNDKVIYRGETGLTGQ
ncbi:hypothetical protein J4N42_01890 [Vibrio sp. SCSIO 43135]|uniref:DUF6701 domain-containing protein n=1 Tax=Vibrio sp. SCSIO 43135 TaxID=2819096 RepID=UPI002074BF70|nr:DUF6701 domain-containing protein [Vibrio sp. SCSIO 43135]USD41505.1 hypothetical protein J4N42_01890 [Vibrio sp. SCSIO 43135]